MIGAHIINGAAPHLSVLQRWQPRLVLLLDPNADDARALRQACPQTYICGRIYVPDGEVSARIKADPEQAARWAHELIVAQSARPYVDSWQIENEVCQFWSELPLLHRFCLKRIELAEKAGYNCAVGGFSVGQPHMPEEDRLAYWRLLDPLLRLLAVRRNHIFVLHQYGAPTLWGPAERGGADWFIHRLEHQVLPRLPSAWQGIRWAVTEYGIDGGVLNGGRSSAILPLYTHGQPRGWRSFQSAADYARDLINIGTYCERWQEQIIGYAVFTLGHNPPWHDFDIRGEVAERLAAHYEQKRSQPKPEQPPVSPPKPGEINMIIYDKENTLRDWNWLADNYKVSLLTPTATAYFSLAEVRETEGPAVVVVQVCDEENRPLPDVLVAFAWPDAPVDLSTVDAQQTFKSRWRTRAAVQRTDNNGLTGFGLGPGSYYDPRQTAGPHTVWVLHHLYASVGLTGIGMVSGTNHRGPLRLVFRLQQRQATGTLTERLRALAEQHDLLPVNPQAALTRAALERNLWPTSREFICEHDGHLYVAQRFRDPRTDDIYVLYARHGEWHNIMTLRY